MTDKKFRDVMRRVSRRDMLKTTMWAGAGVFGLGQMPMQMPRRGFRSVSALKFGRHPMHSVPGVSPVLPKYVDALPIPPVIQPSGIDAGVAKYSVAMAQFRQKLHRNLPPTTLWGYNGMYPGPTFETRAGRPIEVLWRNELPSRHLLDYAYDTSIHGAEPGLPRSRSVVHLHGGNVMPEDDGYPEAWFTNSFAQTGPSFSKRAYFYPNDQPAMGLWYHDHTLGLTRLNVFTGLEGFYIIRDAVEDSLNLPQGDYEIPLMIQDRAFNADGSLAYPIDVTGTHEVWVPEFFGDTSVVNGKIWPYLEVEPRKYRFRLLNGSNARVYHLWLEDGGGSRGPAFNQIGTDGGFLPSPVQLGDIVIAPAERMDMIIDFSGCEGKTFVLRNDANAPYPDGDPTDLTELMQFRVTKRLAGRDTSSLPSTLVPMSMINPRLAKRERTIMLSEADRDSDGYPIIGELGGSPIQATTDNPTGGAMWSDPVTEAPHAGDVEIWNLVNVSGDAHPIHVHLVQFQVLERRQFDLDKYLTTGELDMSGYAGEAPAPNERPAWKDTVVAMPRSDADGNLVGLCTRIIAKWDLPANARVRKGDRLRYVIHCHILEHEDNEMMRPYDVIA